jgi:hypothetical protein
LNLNRQSEIARRGVFSGRDAKICVSATRNPQSAIRNPQSHMVLLKISYKLRAHHVAEYDRTFAERTLPLIREHGFRFWGIWRSVVGDAQEYLELWEFDSVAEFDEKWRKLASDPQLQEIFKVTGPMVEDERLTLFEPSLPGETVISMKISEP